LLRRRWTEDGIPHGLAVFRDRPSRDINAGRAQFFHDRVVRENLARVFGLNQLLDVIATASAECGLTAVGRCDRGREKIL